MSCDKTGYEIDRCIQMHPSVSSMDYNERDECDECGYNYSPPPHHKTPPPPHKTRVENIVKNLENQKNIKNLKNIIKENLEEREDNYFNLFS